VSTNRELILRLREQQQQAWNDGNPVLLEDLLDQNGNTVLDSESRLELIYSEFCLCETAGQEPDRQEFVRRFPEQRAGLQRLFEIHSAIESAEPSTRIGSSGASHDEGISERTRAEPRMDEGTLLLSPEAVARASPVIGRIGDFELLEEIGRGGMGVVYRARDLLLDRTVALKTIRSGQFADSEERDRFRVEAEAAAQLDHAGIVPVYSSGEVDGVCFIAMGYIQGGSLRESLRDGPLDPRDAAALMQQISLAVDYAHGRGVVHRDLKPGNILIGDSGVPRITDFGLARRIGSDSSLTGTGQILGTPGYMPPEQARGTSGDSPLADVYSLGAVLYCLVTGRPPFQAAVALETLRQVIESDPVSPRVLNSAVPRDLETIIAKCLEKSPEQRYSTAADLSDDLQRFSEGHPVAARPLSRVARAMRWCRRKPLQASLVALVSLLVGLAGISTVLVSRTRLAEATADAETGRREVAELTTRIERSARREAQQLANSQSYLASVRRAERLVDLRKRGWRRETLELLSEVAEIDTTIRDTVELRSLYASALGGIDVEEETPVGDGFAAHRIAFGPDSQRLAMGAGRGAVLVELRIVEFDSTESSRTLTFPSVPKPLPWETSFLSHDGVVSVCCSSDGRWLAAGSRKGQVHIWDVEPTAATRVTFTAHSDWTDGLGFSPDSKQLASWASGDHSEDPVIRLWEYSDSWQAAGNITLTKDPQHLTVNPAQPELIGWVLRKLVRIPLTPDASPVPIGDDALSALWPAAAAATVSQDGRIVALSLSGRIGLIDTATGESLATLDDPLLDEVAHEFSASHLSFSSDSSLLLSVSADETAKLWAVPTGELLTSIPTAAEGWHDGAMSPDGKAFAFLGDKVTRRFRIEQNERFGSWAILTQKPIDACTLSPDGQRLAVLSDGELKAWNRDSSELTSIGSRQLPNSRSKHGVFPELSFDGTGRYIAGHAANGSIFVCDLESLELLDGPELNSPGPLTHIGTDGLIWGTMYVEGGFLSTADRPALQAWQLPSFSPVGKPVSRSFAQLLTGKAEITALASGAGHIVLGGRDGTVIAVDAVTRKGA